MFSAKIAKEYADKARNDTIVKRHQEICEKYQFVFDFILERADEGSYWTSAEIPTEDVDDVMWALGHVGYIVRETPVDYGKSTIEIWWS